MTLNTTRSNVCHIYLACVPEFQTLLRIGPWNLKNWKCTVLPQNYLEHLPVKITLNTLSACTRGPYFGPLLSKTSHLRDTRLMKSELYRMTSDWPQMYNVPCSDYALTNKGPNFDPVLSTSSSFQDATLSAIGKTGNVPNDLRPSLNTWLSRYPYTLSTYLREQIVCPFCKTTIHFRDIRLQKIRKKCNAPNNLRLTVDT